jgi:hypothetical protein
MRAPVVATRPAVFDLIHVRVAATSGPGPGSRADGVPALRRPSNLDRRAPPRRSQAGLCRTRFCSAPGRLAGSCRGVQGEAGLELPISILDSLTNRPLAGGVMVFGFKKRLQIGAHQFLRRVVQPLLHHIFSAFGIYQRLSSRVVSDQGRPRMGRDCRPGRVLEHCRGYAGFVHNVRRRR